MHFADELIGRVRALGHPLCVGLDPHLEQIPDPFRRGSMRAGDPASCEAVQAFCAEVIDRLEKRVAVVKPQIALFEQLGARGIQALEVLVERCRARDLMVILDAKRGDIGSTAEGYAHAYLEPGSTLAVDAITLSPYLGRDSLAPFIERCRAHGRGAFVLAKTSNAGSADLQDRRLERGTLFEAVAEMLAEDCASLVGPRTGWSSLGVVVGASPGDAAEKIREKLPAALFLVPGFGAQGADVAQALRGFRASGAGAREGGVVNSSRAILYPVAERWEAGFEAALAEAIDRLGEAVR
ncbi:MAG TPA: orotidine-5'-phosphate decarboxylase [Myxococcota bacterium]|nr:orotidine-5'-phosphate decarboxylase [Myxococcota bacterium]